MRGFFSDENLSAVLFLYFCCLFAKKMRERKWDGSIRVEFCFSLTFKLLNT